MEPSNQIILKIEGMSCHMCTGKVEKALKHIAGVTSVSVDLGKKEAIIIGSAEYGLLAKTVEDLGFRVI
ncbi:heavy-metal-associated domain-containing protein [Sporomusa acidovorans]|uniref:HMA domain-containing protein n=1 Tax=Sporomusa acidovorans (strain ATCC 49682 / DSM 3132 / Mol) TaxID=1123286 RepID=A0ABZ3JBK1_SPOA4|nr:heavy metal-associated domain-containing protein [Sporomusa acidovorans]OZC21734.1 copper-exporting P-type ATPase A [Sporomusa acidovorans DSM 3132]SDD58799.1 copper chaperone [Sporomusa acidovorans]